jgi:predicted ester cyclase
MLDYMYRRAFQARAEFRSRIIADDQAVVEGEFIGTHIGEFAGIPATGRQVRVPPCVVYDLEAGLIPRPGVLEVPVLMRQLGGTAEAAEPPSAVAAGH